MAHAASKDSLTAIDMAEKVALALTNYFSDGSDEFGHVIATRDGTEVHVVAVDEGDAEHEERERRYVITVDSEADRDPVTDPANAKVIMALREAGRFTPPPLGEDRVVAMLRDKVLWKPEYDEVREQQE